MAEAVEEKIVEEKIIAEEEVEKHSTVEDCWIILGNDSNGGANVYDVTKYLDDHPGGPEIMLEFAGKNGDEMFEDINHSSEARSKMKEYKIGKLKEDPNAVKTKVKSADVKSSGGLNPFAIIILLLAIAAGVYFSQLN